MLSPTLLQVTNANDRRAKRKRVPWVEGVTYAKKRRATDWDQGLPTEDNERLAEYETLFLAKPVQSKPATKPPTRPTDIIARIEAWKDGVADKPFSDDESDSTID